MTASHFAANHWYTTQEAAASPSVVGDYPVDYSGDWQFMDGVSDATYTDPSGNYDATIKVKMGRITMLDIQGANFQVSPTDTPFTVFLDTLSGATLEPNGKIVVDGVTYVVRGVLWTKPDLTKARVITRKGRA